MRSRLIFVVLLVVTATGCTSKEKEIQRILESPIEYNSHLSPWADLDNYNTWDWVPAPKGGIETQATNAELQQAIKDAVTKQMTVRDYGRAQGAADLAVNFHIIAQQVNKDYIERMYDGTYLPDYRVDFSGPRSAAHKWQEGSLVVLVFDTKTRDLVWQGSATAEITDGAPTAKSVERINKVMKQMFTGLPGKPRWQKSGS